MKKNIFYLLITLFYLTSCVKEVKYDFKDLEKKVVINSFFCPDSIFKIHLSYTANPYDTSIVIVDNAKIELWSNNHKLDEFGYYKKGYYNSNIKAEINTPYTIKVIVPDYDTIYATDTIPDNVLYELEKNLIYSKNISDF